VIEGIWGGRTVVRQKSLISAAGSAVTSHHPPVPHRLQLAAASIRTPGFKMEPWRTATAWRRRSPIPRMEVEHHGGSPARWAKQRKDPVGSDAAFTAAQLHLLGRSHPRSSPEYFVAMPGDVIRIDERSPGLRRAKILTHEVEHHLLSEGAAPSEAIRDEDHSVWVQP
jgi:hypothetical protein